MRTCWLICWLALNPERVVLECILQGTKSGLTEVTYQGHTLSGLCKRQREVSGTP